MSEPVFHFKHFKILQDKCAMKVGTDGVLFGSWIEIKNATHVLDIGTGSGLIAIMLAQKGAEYIDAIDIDLDSYHQACENALSCPWPDHIKVIHASLQEFKSIHRYDLIVSNPPYFVDSFAPTDQARNIARQASASLSYEELLKGVIRLLKLSGRFCVILPDREGTIFREKAEQNGLFCNRLTGVKTKPSKPLKRVMMEFSRQEAELTENQMIITTEDGVFTEEYKILTNDFYPRFNAHR